MALATARFNLALRYFREKLYLTAISELILVRVSLPTLPDPATKP